MRFVGSFSYIYEARMSSALNGSSAIQRFEGSNAIEIRNGITFDFYTGLPHVNFNVQCSMFNVQCQIMTIQPKGCSSMAIYTYMYTCRTQTKAKNK